MDSYIHKIDDRVLSNPINWDEVKKQYVQSEKNKEEAPRLQKSGITYENHLIYIRALSRVLVDLETFD